MIFKGSVTQAHGRKGTFTPGFGVTISDAVQASCSAYPFFNRKIVTTATGDNVELIDGGYCANNPTLYAIADAVAAFTLLMGPRMSFRTAGMLRASPRTRPSSESRLSVSRSQGSGKRSGVNRCGVLTTREDGVNVGEGGTLIWESLI
jgi:Patatin-like phospholipase